jgi:hypothetical protein
MGCRLALWSLGFKYPTEAMSSPPNAWRRILAVFLESNLAGGDRCVTKLYLRLTLALHCTELADRTPAQ